VQFEGRHARLERRTSSGRALSALAFADEM
jgi:hypothetical protein